MYSNTMNKLGISGEDSKKFKDCYNINSNCSSTYDTINKYHIPLTNSNSLILLPYALTSNL